MSDSLQFWWGWYFLGRIGIRSLVGRQKCTWQGIILCHGQGCSCTVVWPLEGINIDVTVLPHVVGDESFDGLDSNFCPAVAMWKSHGTESVVDSPIREKFSC